MKCLPNKSQSYSDLLGIINELNGELGLENSNQVLILYQINTDKKVNKFFDWIGTKITDGQFTATEIQVQNATVKISKGLELTN